MWLLSQLAGCSSGESAGTSCASQCGDLCKALAGCDGEVPSNCVSQCTTSVAGANCSDSHPPSQLTCAELKESYACADYCATLCTRAPDCGSFDSKLCAQGCTIQSPSICNAASVAARTCDQLKPELRDYEDTARAEQGGSHIGIGFGGTNPYGLCTDADDCELPFGCSLATNTCSPCESDDNCKRTLGSYICSAEKQCTKVECASDADCPGRVCDAQRHVCAECRADADCTGFYERCNTQTATCGQCLSDADCKDDVLAHCDLDTNRCGQCVTNADCAGNPDFPRCDAMFDYCTGCQENADCAGTDRPICTDSQCVVCVVDADCKNPAARACDGLFNTCVECTRPEHCPDGKTCNGLGHNCVDR
ncbi:MAG: hypothetical protein WDO69_12320 [Pseudomonadota bacterium]